MNPQTINSWIKQFQQIESDEQKQAFLTSLSELVRNQSAEEAKVGLLALREQTEDLYRRVSQSTQSAATAFADDIMH